MSFQLILIVFFCVLNVTVTSANCLEGQYITLKCVPCPSNCKACVSDTNCTTCTNGFFGDLCKTPCLQNCSSNECDLHNGKCTYECPDNMFVSKDDNGCVVCPENCGMCNSSSNCFTCKKGYYGQSCSEMCPEGCETCNQSTGHCLQCKAGYYRQCDNCLQCPEGCTTCDNSTYCSKCQESHVSMFQGKCIRKCFDKSNMFASNFEQRCGMSLDEIKSNRSSCLIVNMELAYTCTTLRSCRTLGDDFRYLNTTFKDDVCIRYEVCITNCIPGIPVEVIPNDDEALRSTMCEQTCSIYYSEDSSGKLEQTCPRRTEDNTTSSEGNSYIVCFQVHEGVVSSPEENSTVITVVVVGCVVVIMLIGTVSLLLRKSAVSTRQSQSVEGTQEVHSSYNWTNPNHATSTLHRAATVENVYDRANCSQFVTDSHMYNIAAIPPHRSKIHDNIYDKASCSTFDTNLYNKTCLPLQRRGISSDMYDTASCSTFDTNLYNKTCLPLQRRGISSDMYDTASCSTFVADNRSCNKNTLPLQRPGIFAMIYDTANCFDAVAEVCKNNPPAVPSHQSEVDHDHYDLVNFHQSPQRVTLPTDLTANPENSKDGQDCMYGVKVPGFRNRPDSADTDGYSLCKMVHPDVVI